ncbi:MAG: cytoplasmic protein [Myxococcales bacterium]|nr:cytoplasmic protein [Myxococcales bacterium]
MMLPTRTDDAGALVELEAFAHAEVVLPADAHVIGEPVTITQIRYPGLARAGLLATCKRGDLTYELSLADVVFPAASAGASLVARYRTWLGLAQFPVPGGEAARPHKVEGDDIVVGKPVDLVVLACKSNALRCRLLGSTREVTLRTAVRDEIPGSIITVTPKKQWTHARHPYLSGDVSAVRIDAAVLGLALLALHREDAPSHTARRHAAGDGRPVCRLVQVAPARDDAGGDLLLEAQECTEARAFAEADELLHKVLALDLRHLDAHAMLGERNLSCWPTLALHHFELGVAIGSLTVGEDFDGVLPWRLTENRPFLRCLHGLSRALLRRDRREDAAVALRRLLRLDPADHLGAGARLAAVEAGKTWRELETTP